MEYTQEQLTGFRTAFAQRRKRQIILIFPVLAVLIALAMTQDDSGSSLGGIPTPVLASAGIVLILGALAFSLYNWRCPACSVYLGRTISPKFCSRCGVPLSG